MLKTCPWVDKCRNTLLLGQLVEIRVGLAQPRRAGLCCTQLPQGCIPIVCKAKMAGKKSKKEYQPCAVGSCAAGPLCVASSAIRQCQGFAEVRYKKFEEYSCSIFLLSRGSTLFLLAIYGKATKLVEV